MPKQTNVEPRWPDLKQQHSGVNVLNQTGEWAVIQSEARLTVVQL